MTAEKRPTDPKGLQAYSHFFGDKKTFDSYGNIHPLAGYWDFLTDICSIYKLKSRSERDLKVWKKIP